MGLIVRTDLYVVARTFLKILSDIRLCTLLGLWTLIELEGVATGLDKIASLHQLLKLIVIGRPGNTNRLLDVCRGEGECVVVSVGGKIQVQPQCVCAQITGRRHPAFIIDTEKALGKLLTVYMDHSLIGKSHIGHFYCLLIFYFAVDSLFFLTLYIYYTKIYYENQIRPPHGEPCDITGWRSFWDKLGLILRRRGGRTSCEA